MSIKRYNIILELINSKLKLHNTSVDFLNELNKNGLGKHECMIVEMILLRKPEQRIKDILLFTTSRFDELMDNIDVFLQTFKNKKSFFSFLRNTKSLF